MWNVNILVWTLLLSVALPVLYVLPLGFIYAHDEAGYYAQFPGPDHPRHAPPRKSVREYSVQGLISANSDRGHLFRAISQVVE